MNRPYVKLNSKNIVSDLLKALDENIPKFKAIDGILGITLNGGLSRAYADHLSEIDIVIYLNKNYYEEWQKGNSPIPLGIVKLNGYLYDIKVVAWESEKERSWDSVALWDLSYSKILFDPKGQILELMKDKLSNTPKALDAEGLMFSAWWYYKLAGDIWINRGDPLQGHFILSKAIASLIEALFIANNEYIPHEKWLIHMSRTLNWKPKHWEEKLSKAMSTGDFSIQSLIERQGAIERIWKDIDLYIINKECPEFKLSIMQKYFYDLLKFLVKKEVVTLQEWKTKAGLDMLNGDPFYSIVTVDSEKITLDKEKFLSMSQEDMYYWQYEVLESIRDQKG
ncbi:MAG: DUF4037 domain-containing protein [Clostridiaceae bacterium]|nr:DUF4037 domain-containing protein [Clostridiaceae bacterium]